VIEGNRIYIPAIYVLNKIDALTLDELQLLGEMPNYCPVSSHKEWNLDGLLEMVWDRLDLVRVYTKPKGANPDYNDPVCLKRKDEAGASVEDFCNHIHKTMAKAMRHALVWGTSVKHRPPKVGKEHLLQDEDVVQIVKKV
jgi:ribosome-interacting GTPase 1